MKKTGRTLTVFLSLIVVILVSGVAISLFLLQKETQVRRDFEQTVQDLTTRSAKIEAALKEARKEISLLEAKNTDAEDRINGLLEELDLEKGLNEKIKADNKKVRDDLEAEARSKIELRQKLTQELEALQQKLKEVEDKASGADGAMGDLMKKIEALQQKNDDLEARIRDLSSGVADRRLRNEIIPVGGNTVKEKVDLDRIVVTPDAAREGRVLNVDSETEFLIFDMGSKQGIKQGDVMSVYRGKSYLGDLRVSRVQDEMSAADFIPPFSSRKVRKNDQVVLKR